MCLAIHIYDSFSLFPACAVTVPVRQTKTNNDKFSIILEYDYLNDSKKNITCFFYNNQKKLKTSTILALEKCPPMCSISLCNIEKRN